jgi:hypothetical protein
MYKKFQESVLDSDDHNLMVDIDDNHLIPPSMYDNLNEFIRNFEKREQDKKEKRKSLKGLDKFIEGQEKDKDDER